MRHQLKAITAARRQRNHSRQHFDDWSRLASMKLVLDRDNIGSWGSQRKKTTNDVSQHLLSLERGRHPDLMKHMVRVCSKLRSLIPQGGSRHQ